MGTGQIISIYDINYKIENHKICFIDKEKIGDLYYGVRVYPDYSFKVLEECIEESLFLYSDKIDLAEKLALNKKYYIVEENPWQIIGVISLHKGYTFIDCAEHDDRVVIQCAFPGKECSI